MNRIEQGSSDSTVMRRLVFIYNFLLIIFPVLGIYKSPIVENISVGEVILMLFTPVFAIFAFNRKTRWDFYWVFLLWTAATTCFAVTLEAAVDYVNVFFTLLRLIFHAVIYLWFARVYFDRRIFMKIYKVFVYAAVVFIFLQYAVYLATGRLIPYLLPGLKLRWTLTTASEIYAFRLTESPIRLSAFFVEPASYAQFVTPFLVWLLFRKEKRTKTEISFIALICASVAISTSASFLFSIAAVLCVWYMHRIFIAKNTVTPLFILVAIIAAGAVFLMIYSGNDTLDMLIGRFTEVDSSKGATSGNMRVLRGFAVFGEVDFINKLFGVGAGNTYGYMINHNIRTQYDYSNAENQLNYMNGISSILVWGGISGLLLYLSIMFRRFMRSDTVGKAMIFYLAILMFSASIYVMPVYVLLMTVIFGSEVNSNEKSSSNYPSLLG